MLEGLLAAIVLCWCVQFIFSCIGWINFLICLVLYVVAIFLGHVKERTFIATILACLVTIFMVEQWDFERPNRPRKMSKKEWAAYNERKAKEREEERVAEFEKTMEEIRVKQEFEDAKRYELEHKIWAKRVPLPANTGE